jgi:hypothetical protein
MQRRRLLLIIVVAVVAWLVPEMAHAGLKLATFNVKGMVCQA